MTVRRWVRAGGAAVVVSVLAAGCAAGSKVGGAASRGHAFTIEAVAASTAAARTAHVDGTIAATDRGQAAKGAFRGDADFSRPASAVTFAYSGAEAPVGGELIIIGKDAYFRTDDPAAHNKAARNKYEKLPSDDVFASPGGGAALGPTIVGFGVADPLGALRQLRSLTKHVRDLGQARVRGIDAEHEQLTTTFGALFGCEPPYSEGLDDPCSRDAAGAPATIDVWVDAQSRMIRLDAKLVVGTEHVESRVDYSRFGAPVRVAAPPKDQVLDLAALAPDDGFEPAQPVVVTGAWKTVASGTVAGTQWSLAVAPLKTETCVDFMMSPSVPVTPNDSISGSSVTRDGHQVQCSDTVLGRATTEVEVVVSTRDRGAIDAIVGRAAPDVQAMEVHLGDGTAQPVTIDPQTHTFAWVGAKLPGLVAMVADSAQGKIVCNEYADDGFSESGPEPGAPPTELHSLGFQCYPNTRF